jgi:uncharacterized membrane protein YkvA (DUF1232 family)/trans-aconitate methyltransferase
MQRLWSEAEAAYRAKILDALEPRPDARLLDLGCDDGAWTDVIRRKLNVEPDRVAGLELVAERSEVARSRGFDARVGDLDDEWPFESRSFDVVHANQVIEHVTHLDHFVEETQRVLRPDGCAIVCTENLASWHNVGALALGFQPFSLTNISDRGPVGNPFALHAGERPRHGSWQHVHVMSLAALRDLFRAHGFRIDCAWATGYHPFAGRLAARLAALDPRHAHFIGVVARSTAEESLRSKLVTIAAALYVLLPFDAIPDFIPIVGRFDDALIVALVVASVKRQWFAKLRILLRRRVLAAPL